MAGGEHPKSTLTAWERWELASFDPAGATTAIAAPPKPVAPEPGEAEIRRIVDQARREGHEAGFAAGRVEGLAAGKTEAEAMGRDEASRLALAAESLDKGIQELNQAVAAELLALSTEIARQLVRQTVATKPDVILAVIREALDQMPLLHAAIRLHPEDASLVRLRAGDQLTHAGHRIHEDPKLKRGDVVIDAGGSHLDASLSSRWRRVVEALGQDTPWIDPAGDR